MKRLRYAVTGRLRSLTGNARARLLDRRTATADAVRSAVAEIVDRVRRDGDAALRELAQTFDRVTIAELEVPRDAWRDALSALPPDIRSALMRAAENIARTHTAWLPQRSEIEVEPGVRVIRRPVALDSVGVYAPGGRTAYASSVLMGVVPARVAGVREIIVCSPPAAAGRPADIVLAAAEIAGATRLFAVGGAGAIAAMALGTTSIPPVDCIVGPGSAYVTEAKLQLMRHVRTDLPAGPSELLVIADDSADLLSVAAEMCAQAEHGAESCVVAILVGRGLAQRLHQSLSECVRSIASAKTVQVAFSRRGAILEAESIDEALAFADAFAPEHLVIAARDAALLAERARNAGSVFVGCSSSVTFGDYLTGANHVLPTAGYARTHSGLSTDAVMRWTTVQIVEPHAARRLAPIASAFATVEGLDAHAAAARRAGAVAS